MGQELLLGIDVGTTGTKAIAFDTDGRAAATAYEEYIQYWGQPEDYVVVPPTVNYTYIDTYFKNALQQTLSSSYQNQTVKAILEDQYEDCVSYIELYA